MSRSTANTITTRKSTILRRNSERQVGAIEFCGDHKRGNQVSSASHMGDTKRMYPIIEYVCLRKRPQSAPKLIDASFCSLSLQPSRSRSREKIISEQRILYEECFTNGRSKRNGYSILRGITTNCQTRVLMCIPTQYSVSLSSMCFMKALCGAGLALLTRFSISSLVKSPRLPAASCSFIRQSLPEVVTTRQPCCEASLRSTWDD